MPADSNPTAVDGTTRRAPRQASNKGRGTVWPIAHRFATVASEAYDDGWGTLEQAAAEEVLSPGTQVVEERVKIGARSERLS